MAESPSPPRPHAVCLPFPAQGHINPMMKFAILLHHRGFHITFVNTEYNHKRILNSRAAGTVDGLPGFQFRMIPDGLPNRGNGADPSEDIVSLCISTSKNCLAPFTRLLRELNDGSAHAPPVSCLVADTIMTFGLRAAKDVGVRGVILRMATAGSLMCYAQISQLREKGLVPLKDESCLTNGSLDLETQIDWIPGMIPLRLKDFPSFIRTTDPNNPMMEFLVSQIKELSDASAVIINTFDELEHDIIEALGKIFPPIYTVGPLQLFVKQLPEKRHEWMSTSLWKEETECLKWLDSKEPNSVIYVNFGSLAVLTGEQLNQFARGLAESMKDFLWIVRPNLVQGKNPSMPAEYCQKMEGRGFIAGWCPQEEVLSHRAVGGFLTHCGWNSMQESLMSGVPMVCWPFFADQHINCRYACDAWGVGMEIENDVKGDEVSFLVRELLDGERGKRMKKRAMEWKDKAEKAIVAGGSSFANLDRIVQVLTG